MFANSIIIFHQMIVMAMLVAAGYFFYRKGIIDNPMAENLSLLLSKYVIPATIIISFQRTFDSSLAILLLILFLCALGLIIITILLARSIYKPKKYGNYADRQMCVIFSNNGFLALPLLKSMFGDFGVFLGSSHIVAMAVVLWTYGVSLMEGKKFRLNIKTAILNPGVAAMFIGMIVFISPVKLPDNIYTTLGYISNLMTPLAMFVLGSFLAQVDFKSCFDDLSIWKISFIRLVFVPIIAMIVLYFVPLDLTAKITLLVATAAPTAILSSMFAKIYKTDYLFSTRVVALSTIMSLLTLPLLIAVFDFINSL